MTLYLKETTIEELNNMLAHFQGKVDFLKTKYSNKMLPEFQDMVKQIEAELKVRIDKA